MVKKATLGQTCNYRRHMHVLHRTLYNATPGQTHKYRRHMYIHTKHFAKQVRKSLMHQEDIEIKLDMFIQGKKKKKKKKKKNNTKQ